MEMFCLKVSFCDSFCACVGAHSQIKVLKSRQVVLKMALPEIDIQGVETHEGH